MYNNSFHLRSSTFKDNVKLIGMIGFVGLCLGSGAGSLANNVEALGVWNALAGAKTGLLETNWTTVGTWALGGGVVGTAVGCALSVVGLVKDAKAAIRRNKVLAPRVRAESIKQMQEPDPEAIVKKYPAKQDNSDPFFDDLARFRKIQKEVNANDTEPEVVLNRSHGPRP